MKSALKQAFKTGLAFFILITVTGCQNTVFSLYGDAVMTLEVNALYIEQGAVISDDSLISTTGFVDVTSPGTYTITYTATVNQHPKSLTRSVTVVDTSAPELTLDGSNPALLCPNMTYQEEGFSAFDAVDGDLASQVWISLIPNGLKYSVKDHSNNLTELTRFYRNEDTQKPSLTLQGYAKVLVHLNTDYIEFGANATDNCDDVSKDIVITNPVNSKVVGLYKVTYTVTDKSGNTSSITRDVEVTTQVQSQVYLTFDDGPSARTKEILDILKRYNMKATFFVLKTNPVYEPIMRRAIKEGHTVAIHGYSHNFHVIYASPEAFFDNLLLAQNWVESVTGIKSYLTRFPGGSSNTSSSFNPGIMTTLTQMIVEKGYHYFDWNVSSGDGNSKIAAELMISNVTKNIKIGRTSIVLMHDSGSHHNTVEALPKILDYLVSIDAEILPITMETPQSHHQVKN